ncbi:MAG: hypothetical protein Q9217_000922 [Psora testacea]
MRTSFYIKHIYLTVLTLGLAGMPPDGAIKPARSGLSLYANLLDPGGKDSAPGTISGAPVVYKQPQTDDALPDASAADKQQISAALRFQPTKRPHISAQKPKAKASIQRPAAQPPIATASKAEPNPPSATNHGVVKTTLADWTADGDDNDVNGFYAGEKRQRGGRKKRKKNKEETHTPQNWDDIYDPSRPNTYENYKNSDEKVIELREWKDRLSAHRMTRRRSSESFSDSQNNYRPMINKKCAPLTSVSFAPPSSFDKPAPSPPTPLPEPAHIANDPTGEDAYARRMRRMSQVLDQHPAYSQQPQPPPSMAQARFPSAQMSAAQPSISRAPIRYNLPPPPTEIPSSEAGLENVLEKDEQVSDILPGEENVPRSLRPGQKGFAERLMSKYGWSKGSGLGASRSGITAPLRVQLEKQKKKPDSEGGGFAGPGGMGKILGGKKNGGAGADDEQGGKFGAMSEVVVLKGMVDGMDLDAEIGAGDGGLMQEIGEECSEKYGRVERVFIDRSNPAKALVFVKFTSQLSALRAVNALEGRIFDGNTITAKFFDAGKFESGNF